jgi:hypothetical protein
MGNPAVGQPQPAHVASCQTKASVTWLASLEGLQAAKLSEMVHDPTLHVAELHP